MRMKRTLHAVLPAAVFGSLLLAAPLSAQQYERDVRFAKELNKIGLFDFADAHIKELIAKNGQNDILTAQLMDNLLSQGKTDAAMAMLKNMNPSSPAYYDALAAVGVFRLQRQGDIPGGIASLELVYKYAKEKNLLTKYDEPMRWLAFAYQKAGKNDKGQAVMAELSNAANQGADDDKRGGDFRRRLEAAVFAMNGIEAMKTKQTARFDELKKLYAVRRGVVLANPADAAKLPALEKAMGEKSVKYYNTLLKDKAYYTSLKAGDTILKNTHPNTVARRKAYSDLGKLLGISDADIQELADLATLAKIQPERLRIVSKGIAKQSEFERLMISKPLPQDWISVIAKNLKEFEDIQWGGRENAETAIAIIQTMRCYYYLGDYDAGLFEYSKNKDIFKGWDDAYRQDKNVKPEDSPGADARMWEGNLALARAEEAENAVKPEEKAKAIKYYKRAFVAFGKLLKDFPNHRDGVKNYPKFQKVAQKVAELEPKMADKVNAEVAKVKPPVAAPGTAEIENLLAPLVEAKYKEATQAYMDIQKKIRAKQPVSDIERQNCDRRFADIMNELLPLLSGKRNSTGLPKLLNRLIISAAHADDIFLVRTLGDFSVRKFIGDPLVAHGLIVAGNTIWEKADLLKNAKQASEEDLQALRDDAISVYDNFLAVDKSNANAPQVAVRIAREEFLRANALGKVVNSETDAQKRADLVKEWTDGFDRAIARYDFVIKNFANRGDLVDEAYDFSADAYTTTKRYMQAVEMNKRFCAAGSDNKPRLINAKMNIATNLYSQAGVYERAAKAAHENAAAVEPGEAPAKPAEFVPATAPAAPAATPAPGTAPAAAAPAKTAAQIAADLKAENEAKAAEYQKALKDYEAAVEVHKTKSEQFAAFEKEAEDYSAKAKECYNAAIENNKELLSWFDASGRYNAYLVDKGVQKTLVREASLRPWLYDGIGDKANAAAAFENFITRHGDDPTAPQYIMRLSVLYTEMNKNDQAQIWLNKLSSDPRYKDSPEAKNAKFFLAKVYFTRGNFTQALAELESIFSSAELLNNLSVSNFRWIASDLAKCASPDPAIVKQAASFATRASEELLKKIEKPGFNLTAGPGVTSTYSDWVGDANARNFNANPDKAGAYFDGLKERLLMEAGQAAYKGGDFKKAVEFYTRITKKYEGKKTLSPFFYPLYFGRADAHVGAKDFAAARKDLARIAAQANMVRENSNVGLYNKAQTKIAETFELEGDRKRAFSAYSMVAGSTFSEKACQPDPENPDDDSAAYLEKAVYKAAVLAKELGNETESKTMGEKYKKFFPNGKYKAEINQL